MRFDALDSSFMVLAAVLPFAALAYLFLYWERARATGSGGSGLGVIAVVTALMLAGALLAIEGLRQMLGVILSVDDWDRLKFALPKLLVGGGVVAALYLFVAPRVHWASHEKAVRMLLGAIGLIAGVAFIGGTSDFLATVFNWPSWAAVATGLANVLVYGTVMAASLYLFGSMSGVEMPDVDELRAMAAQRQHGGGAPAPMPPPPVQQRMRPPAPGPRTAPQQAVPQQHPGQYDAGYEDEAEAPRTTAIPTPGSPGWEQGGGQGWDQQQQGGQGGWEEQRGGGQGGGGGWGNEGGGGQGGGGGGGGWGRG